MFCKQVGDCNVTTYDRATGSYAKILLTNVLISEHFPFHIFSEIVAFDKGMQCSKKKSAWTFFNDDGFVVQASQRLLSDPAKKESSD